MKMYILKRRLSLKNKIVGSFLILILFSSLVIGLYTYNQTKSNIESIVGNTALSDDCKHSVNKVYELANISRNFSAGSQQAAASTEEQSAIMQQIKENLENIKQTTYCLNDVVNKFKID